MAKLTTAGKKKKTGKVLFAIEMLVLLVLIVCLYIYSKVWSGVGKMSTDEKMGDIKVNEPVITSEVMKGYQNIALVGVDKDGDVTQGNSDTMIIASINNDTKEVKLVSLYRDTLLNIGDGEYNKANYAFAIGGKNQFLSMLNTNLDLNISDYVVVDFDALVKAVDDLGGLDISLTHDEVVHMNNYAKQVSEVVGQEYEEVEEPDRDYIGEYHLSGVQVTSYARIRYTAGNDFKRASRQRLVIEKIVEKAKKASISTLTDIMDDVFPLVNTSFSKTDIVQMGSSMLSYTISETTGFPFVHWEISNYGDKELDPVLPVTLESNVVQLHKFLFDEDDYQVSDEVKEYSRYIAEDTGYGEDEIENAKAHSDASVPNIGSESDGQ